MRLQRAAYLSKRRVQIGKLLERQSERFGNALWDMRRAALKIVSGTGKPDAHLAFISGVPAARKHPLTLKPFDQRGQG